MKIAITGYVHPFGENVSRYGAERLIYYLICELKKQGHECVVFAGKGCNLPGFEYIALPIPFAESIDIYYAAIQKYEVDHKIKFDVVHSYQCSGMLDPRLRNEYVYCMEPFPIFNPNIFKDNIIAYSKKHNSVMQNVGTVIYPGIPEGFYSGRLLKNRDYLVWVGRIDAGKGTAHAIEVAKQANKKLILMGPSYHYPYFVEKVWPHIDGEKVIWLRGVDDAIKKRVLKRALAFINPIWGNYHEMFGITNVEALAMGVPIIGWNNVEVPSAIGFDGGEVIENGKHGFIINHAGYSVDERELAISNSVTAVHNIKDIDRTACQNLFKERFTAKIMADNTLKYYSIIQRLGKVANITNQLR